MQISYFSNMPFLVIGALSSLTALSILGEVLFEDRRRIHRRLRDESRLRLRNRASQSRLFKDWKASVDPRLDERQREFWERARTYLEQSGTGLTLWHIAHMSLWAGGVLAAVGIGLGLHPVWAACLAVVGSLLPSVYVWYRRRKRIEQLREQLPETFDLMSRSVQAGTTLVGAFQLVAKQCGAPVAEEFSYCCEQQNLGLPYEATLRDLARRTGVMELQMFAIALILQRQAGGDPTELLNNLSEVVRKRTKLAMKVRAITSEGRMQACMLSMLPFLSLAGIYVLDRSYAEILLEQRQILAGLCVSIVIGTLWIRRIINIEY